VIRSKDILATAARIALTEAQHAGVIRELVLAGADQRGGFFPDGVNGSGPLNRA
jgi:hypothetical protein